MRVFMTRKAFTVVELLVVLAIIAVLAALLFPIFQSARASARTSVCLSNLKQIGVSVALYAVDYDDKIPYAPDPKVKYSRLRLSYPEPLRTDIAIMPDVVQILAHYGAPAPLFECPSDPWMKNGSVVSASYNEYGDSYEYCDDKAFLGQTLSGFSTPAQSLLMWEEAFYHSGSDESNGTVNNLFADLHVKTLPRRQTVFLLDASF